MSRDNVTPGPGNMLLSEKEREFYESHGLYREPEFNGQRVDRGEIIVGREYPNEGHVILKCGGTEVKIGATIFFALGRAMSFDSESHYFADYQKFKQAWDALTCEALVYGRTP